MKLLKLVSKMVDLAETINDAQIEHRFSAYHEAKRELMAVCETLRLLTGKKDIVSVSELRIASDDDLGAALVSKIEIMGERIYTLTFPCKALAMLAIEPNSPQTYYNSTAKEIWDFIAECASNYLSLLGFDLAAQALDENFFSDKWDVDENDGFKRGKNVFINFVGKDSKNNKEV